ncbi:hypothetical protein ABW21_db0203535 [Orbilia brochopaga]|nr:hypothetical protein ABW21_db0203535 [Drechslerella brochopaga]
MDMTSLSSTLPGNSNGNPNQSSSRNQQRSSKQLSPEPTDDGQTLIESFQAAARSVTNLYRGSAALIRNSRQDGYTDALSDVLEAIDNESAYNDPSLALSRIRDWVIDRRHDMKGGSSSSGATSGQAPPSQQQREMSTESEMDDAAAHKDEEQQSRRQDPTHHDTQQQHSAQPFMFQPLHPIPQYPLQTTDVVEQLQSPPESGDLFTFNSPVAGAPTGRAGGKVPPGARGGSNINGGAGTKRRNQYVDFFDISGFGNFGMGGGGRDAGGGQGNAKRGRYA